MGRRPVEESDYYYQIQTGAYRIRSLAEQQLEELRRMGFPAFLVYDGTYFKLRVGAFKNLDNAVRMEQELRKKEKNITKQYWDMVSLLVAVLNHNNLVETEHQDDISFYMEQVYRQLQKNYPEYGITEEEIENVSHLAPIHDIGKIRVSIEILNKNGKLTIDEMEVVKQHPICRKKKKTWYDSKTAC